MAIHSRISFRYFLILLLILILFIPTSLSRADDEDDEQILEFRPEAALALGWNSVKNRPTNAREVCLDKSSFEEVPSKSTNASYNSGFRLVHSKTDIQDAFGLDVSASYRGIAYKAEGSVKYASSKDVNAESVNLAGYVKVDTRADSLRASDNNSFKSAFLASGELDTGATLAARMGGIKIDKDYAQLYLTNPEEFFNTCGDGFVMDIFYGGRLNIIATLDTKTEAAKQSLQASLKGSGGGVEVDVDAVVSSAKSSEGTIFNASYQAVGSDGSELKIGSIDQVKSTFDNFTANARQNDAGVRMRIVSYKSLMESTSGYRFGPGDSVTQAARLYSDLTSVWHTLAQLKDGSLTDELRWEYSVDKQCLANKQDEIYQSNQNLLTKIQACSKELNSIKGIPAACESNTLRAGLQLKSGSSSCPATTQIIDGQLSQYDYRLFYPPVKQSGVLPNCRKWDAGQIQQVVSTQWLDPTIDTQCRANPNQPQCVNATRAKLTANVHVVDTSGKTTPLQPEGLYKKTCNSCTLKWTSDGKAQMQCSCSKGGDYKNTAWVTLQCPQKKRLNNCRRTLHYGNCS